MLRTDVPKSHQMLTRDTGVSQINKYAFSGGGATLEDQRAKGANLDVDVSWKYLNFFMEDDLQLAKIGEEYASGRMLTGEFPQTIGLPGSCSQAPTGPL